MVGVDPGLMATMASIESTFRTKVKADTSSATGLYQFIDKTWKAGHRAADMLLVDVLFGDLDVVHRWPLAEKGAACPSLLGVHCVLSVW